MCQHRKIADRLRVLLGMLSTLLVLLASPHGATAGLIVSCASTAPSIAQPSGYSVIPIESESRVGCGLVTVQLTNNQSVIAHLWWEPGVPADTSSGQVVGGEVRGFLLTLTPLDASGHPIEVDRVEIAVPSPPISRRTIEPPVYTGSLSVDPDLRTILVVAGESEGTHMWLEASEFTFEVNEAAESIELVRHRDRLGDQRCASIATGLAEGQRPLIASVERVDDEIVLGIAPWHPGEERTANPTPTRRARLSPDFKQVIAVEEIPTVPPPADPPPSNPPPADPE